MICVARLHRGLYRSTRKAAFVDARTGIDRASSSRVLGTGPVTIYAAILGVSQAATLSVASTQGRPSQPPQPHSMADCETHSAAQISYFLQLKKKSGITDLLGAKALQIEDLHPFFYLPRSCPQSSARMVESSIKEIVVQQ